jgi:hypothetical protein
VPGHFEWFDTRLTRAHGLQLTGYFYALAEPAEASLKRNQKQPHLCPVISMVPDKLTTSHGLNDRLGKNKKAARRGGCKYLEEFMRKSERKLSNFFFHIL